MNFILAHKLCEMLSSVFLFNINKPRNENFKALVETGLIFHD